MRSFLPSYRLRNAATLDAALAMLAEEPGAWRPFAGGTDLMVQLAAGTLEHRQYVNVFGLKELRYIDVASNVVTLGGLTTFSDALRNQTLQTEFPLLCRAAADTGGVANQNRGTIAGNIANASPAADSPPALLVYDAELELVSVRGRRVVPYERFHTGYKQMDLAPDELIVAIRLPRTEGWIPHYRKVGARRAQAISKVCFAARARMDGGRVADLRLAFGSVAPTVVRAIKTEALLRSSRLDPATLDKALQALDADLAPIDDVRSTAAYRRRVAANLLIEFLDRLRAA
jgi:CO/xanthine dehydrogenase FAD-binding subunit